MLTCGRDRRVLLWDLESRQIISRLRQRGNVSAVAFSPDGGRAGVAYSDGAVRVFDLTGDILTQPVSQTWEQRKHTDNVVSLDFSADGDRLISTSRDESALVWDADTGKIVHEFPCYKNCFSGSLVSTLRNEVLIPLADGKLVLKNLDTGNTIAHFQVPVEVGVGYDGLAWLAE
jgi:WD40 repeat protein